jgi:LCP family protein required for cell wall assembly
VQRVFLTVGIIFVVMCLGGTSVAGYILATYGSIDRVSDIDIAEAPPGEPRNFLLVGSDNREGTADEGAVSGRRSDTIIVARLDPESDRIGLVSFPRDLLVTRADTNDRDQINHAYSAENGEQVLIDTIALNFGIPIHHYVEVRFQAFQQLVEAIGGVELWIPNAIQDEHSGLFIEQLGCVTLNGDQGLLFARSRYLEFMNEDGEWESDPYSDISRTQRQQIFIKRALSKALGQVQSNPLRMRELIDIGTSNVRLDDQLGVSEMLDLANDFRDFSADRLETYPLPVVDSETQSGRLELDEDAAEPILNVFRGLDPSEVGPGVINVQVLNGTDRQNLATDISAALQHVGFDMGEPSDTPERPAHTVVYHGPGQQNYGMRVARHVTGGADVVERPDITAGDVVLVAGGDFQTIHDQPTPVDRMPTTTVAGQPAGTTPTTAAPAEEAPTTTTAPPPTTTTTVSNGYIVGEPPPGAHCP